MTGSDSTALPDNCRLLVLRVFPALAFFPQCFTCVSSVVQLTVLVCLKVVLLAGHKLLHRHQLFWVFVFSLFVWVCELSLLMNTLHPLPFLSLLILWSNHSWDLNSCCLNLQPLTGISWLVLGPDQWPSAHNLNPLHPLVLHNGHSALKNS